MRRSILRGSYAALAAVLFTVPSLSASAQVVNGNFESSIPAPSGSYTNYGAGSNFGGWTVAFGNVDLINGLWQAADGTYSVDMDGSTQGGIFQDIVTTMGSTYNLTFALSGNPAGPPAIKSLNVFWDGLLVKTSTYDITGNGFNNMNWVFVTVPGLVASSALTRLQFNSADDPNVACCYGPALDAVSLTDATPQVSATPEPASIALMATGLAGVAVTVRRRRRAASRAA